MSTVTGVQLPDRLDGAWSRIRRLSPGTLDAVLGTVFVLVGFLSTTASSGGNPSVIYEARDAPAYALILASTAPYFLRRRAPLPVFSVSVIALVTLSWQGYNEGVIPLMALVGAYTVGAHRPASEGALAGVVAALAIGFLYLADVPGFDAGELASNAAVFGSAILVGRNVQSRRLRLDALERGHEEATARAASEERLRIAQEVHDVVAHSLGVIAVQAGVGLHVLDTDPDETRTALENITRTSRESLAEIRGLLGAVRARDGAADYAPAPTLAELPRLVRDVELAGLRVDLHLAARSDDLPVGVQLAAYRIVQEALTNTLRHAAADHVDVRIDQDGGVLTLEVVDDGRGPSSVGVDAPGGHGLVGMRERVALYGGSFHAGPGPTGGFRVVAELPLSLEPAG